MVAVMMPITILGTPTAKRSLNADAKTEPAILQAHAVYESEPQVCGKVNIVECCMQMSEHLPMRKILL